MDAPGECRIKRYGDHNRQKGNKVATSVVAKEVWISGELSYVVIMRTHENYRGRKVFLYQNCGFYGKVVILKKTEEGFEVLRFRARTKIRWETR